MFINTRLMNRQIGLFTFFTLGKVYFQEFPSFLMNKTNLVLPEDEINKAIYVA